MTRIYTRAGDDGSTRLAGGSRVSKSHPRIAALGELDELNAALGAARAFVRDLDLQEILGSVQRNLLAIGAQIANPENSAEGDHAKTSLSSADVERLETRIDRFQESHPFPKHFLLPGGSSGGALLHVARAVARRAERAAVALATNEPVRPLVLAYLNRLSDLLFVLAHEANRRDGVSEEDW